MQTFIKTYGCTLNQADSDIMEGLLSAEGITAAGSMDAADVVIVNTCTVKTPTEQKVLHELAKLEHAGKRVVVAGCMASANGDLVKKYAPGASIVTTSNVHRIVSAVREAAAGRRVVLDTYSKNDKLAFPMARGAVVVKVPVSEGCLSSCAFCETKFARGPLNSFSEDRIVNAVKAGAGGGAREVQLTSQDMGAYGLDNKTDIAALMERLGSIEGDFRVRVGMLNPEHLHKYMDRFTAALQGGRFYRFVHLPVQSGSDRVLGDMKRGYSAGQVAGYFRELRRAMPDVTIETDIIVGYPSETEEDFGMTLDFVRDARPNVVNMCKFWARPHAAASRLKQLPTEVILSRSAELGRVVRAVQRGINETFIGRTCDITITEQEGDSISGRTDTYKKVILKAGRGVGIGADAAVRITGASCNVLYAAPLAEVEAVVV